MKRRSIVILAMWVLALATGWVHAEDLVLFSAAQAGADIWIWGKARVKASGGALLVTERNPEADYGDAHLADRFPYFAGGRVELDVAETTGRYTLQALAFRGEDYLESIDLARDTDVTGVQSFNLAQQTFPAETDHLMFKLWVGGGEAAQATVNDLRYVLPIAEGSLLLDKRFDTATGAEPDHARWVPGPDGGTMTLSGDQEYGSVLLPDVIRKPRQGLILMDAVVSNGTVTAQLVMFDSNRDYIESKDAIERAGSGFSTARLDTMVWPANAAHFQLKLWLAGNPDCSARIRRIVVVDQP